MNKHYPFWDFEPEILALWEGQFSCKPASSKTPYTIIMPPPNVTGYLHLGHAFSSTLQDILIRWKRMQGFDVLWLPGTDHAGIATQMMVEKQLLSEGKTRSQLGRQAFLERVWQWKEKYGNLIIGQMKSMGFSANWSYLSFTLDPPIYQSVIQAFVTLYEKKLVYRAKRLINWDPVLQTAVSDLEVVSKERTDPFWTIRYDIEGGGHIDIATTRPETLFGDTAIAVHPDDARYKSFVGRRALVPLTQRSVPIISDEAIMPDKGTGAVKITPAHDFLDFEISVRHGLDVIDVFDENGILNEHVDPCFQGMDAGNARPKVIEALGRRCLHQISLTHAVPHSERSGATLQPRLTDQWFVDMKDMAQKGLEAAALQEIRFIPAEWKVHYDQWLTHIRPWCVSRQLWWGHQIPAWYGPDGRIFVSVNEEGALLQAKKVYADPFVLTQDEDVLDTWFSSGLWPFSTLGWPAQTEEMARYYPGDVLITGFDILFFWVARMIMLGCELTQQIPFKEVYLHPLIRDEQGQKMSKTKGNVIDPLDVAKDYGADALRFALAWIAAPAHQVSFGLGHVENSRNFITKLWNMGRFLSMNHLIQPVLEQDQPIETQWLFNQWILFQTKDFLHHVTSCMQGYRFHEAAAAAYEFTWKIFCDWYIEFVKEAVRHSPSWKSEIQQTVTFVFKSLLCVLHPFIPFVTEKLWLLFGFKGLLCHAKWPVVDDYKAPEGADWLIEMITQVRRVRSDFQLPSQSLPMRISSLSAQHDSLLKEYEGMVCRLLKIDPLFYTQPSESVQEGSIPFFIEEARASLFIGNCIHIEKECDRLEKKYNAAKEEQALLEKRLSSADFIDKAPTQVVDDLRSRLSESLSMQKRCQELLAYLQR